MQTLNLTACRSSTIRRGRNTALTTVCDISRRPIPDHLKKMDDSARKVAGVFSTKMGDRHNKHIEDIIGFASDEVNFVMALAAEMMNTNKNNNEKSKQEYKSAQVVDVVSTVDENDAFFN